MCPLALTKQNRTGLHEMTLMGYISNELKINSDKKNVKYVCMNKACLKCYIR